MTIKLHGVVGSPFVNSALMSLEETGSHYEFVPMSFAQKGSMETAAVRLNPFKRVPVLEDGAFSLYETQAILRYVAARHPDVGLVPTGIEQRARMDQLMGICDSYLMPQVVRTIVTERLFTSFWNRDADEARVAAAVPDAEICLAEIERIAAEHVFLADETFSLADIHLFPFLHYVALTPEGAEILAGCPRLSDWLTRVRHRKSMRGLNLVGLASAG